MKKILLTALLAIFSLGNIYAQSTMTDDQLIKFVIKEQQAGSSQQQIVTKLVQRGVNIDQIRRVRKKYERMQKNEGLGTVRDKSMTEEEQIDARLRRNNAKDKSELSTTEKLKDERLTTKRQEKDIKAELDDFLPDSLDIYDRQVIENYLKQEGKGGKRVFGRDIFNNQELTFEPNMNIATPENYVLGAGDAVLIDIYGASQKTVEATVSPDGFVVVEGYGPIQVAGLTVAQANSRIRSQLGARYSSSKIRLTVGQTRTITINVMGEVKTPGTYTLAAFASVVHAFHRFLTISRCAP